METTMIINLGLTAVVGLFILFGFFWGLIRGLRKTAFRGVWLICTAVISLFLSQTIANLIININLSSLGILNIGEQSYSTIKEFIMAYASEAIGSDVLTQIPSLSSLIESLPLMLCSPIIFGLLFWLLKIILWPIWAILARIFIKKPEKKKKHKKDETKVVVVNNTQENSFATNKQQLEQKNPKKPIKKHAWLGGLLGIVVGIIVCGVTFVPVFGVLDIVNELDKVEVYETTTPANNEDDLLSLAVETDNENENELNKTTLLNKLLGNDRVYVDAVNNSVGTTILTITGMKALGTLEFNYLSTIKVGEKRISAKNEIKSALKVVNDISFISTIDLNHPTQEDINAIIEASNSILDYINESDLISLLGDEALNYISNGMLNEEDFFIQLPETGSVHTDKLLEELVKLGTTYSLSDLVNDIKSTINILKVINDENLIAPLINEEVDTSSTKAILTHFTNVSEEFSTNLTNAIFNINIVSALTPYLSNALIETLINTINDPTIEFTPVDISENIEIYKTQFTKIFTDAFTLLFSIDANSDYLVTSTTISTAGKLLDNIVSEYEDENENIYYIISPETFDSFVSYAVNDLKSQIDNPDGGFPDELKITAKNIVENISVIQDYSTYEEEFGKIADAFELTIPYIEEFKKVEQMSDLKETKIQNMGLILNNLQDTILIGNELVNLFNSFIEFGLKDVEIENTTTNDLIAILKITDPQNANIDWENEFAALEPLFNQIVTTTDFSENILLSQSFLKNLGSNLQIIKNRNNNLIYNTALLDIDGIISELLNIYENLVENQDIKNALTNLSITIKDYENKSQINYKDEFIHISNLTQVLNSPDFTIENASNVIKNILNGTNDANATKVLDKVIFKTIIDKLPNASDYSTNNAIYNILTTAKINVENYKSGTLTINNTKQEILNILDLVDLIEDVNTLDLNDSNIDKTIETISIGIQTIQFNTKIFTNLKTETVNYMFNLIKDEINSTSDLYTIINTINTDINNNLDNITIKNIYDDMKLLENRFETNVEIDIDSLDNQAISGINVNLIEILNRPSFTKATTNAIYKTILNGINQKVQDLDATNELPEIQTQLATFKSNVTNLIDLEKLNIETKSEIDLKANYYEQGLTNIKNYVYSQNPLNKA